MLILLLAVTALATITAWADGRVARVKQGVFLYSNWDAPVMTLDSCLDKSITQVKIPDSVIVNGRNYPVVEIGPRAFNECLNLTRIEIGKHMYSILREAFHNCPNLRILSISNPKPFKLEDAHPFYGGKFSDIFESYHAQSVVLVVPQGSEETYHNTPGWCEFQKIQSTMPTDDQLNNSVIDGRIGQLENELQQAREHVRRLEAELDALKRANPPR
jgi:hypothetical protein